MAPTETCMMHDTISRACSLIPELRADVTEIKEALLGTMDKPGWIGRVADLEKQAAEKAVVELLKRDMAVIRRVAWGVVAAVALGGGSYVWSLIVK